MRCHRRQAALPSILTRIRARKKLPACAGDVAVNRSDPDHIHLFGRLPDYRRRASPGGNVLGVLIGKLRDGLKLQGAVDGSRGPVQHELNVCHRTVRSTVPVTRVAGSSAVMVTLPAVLAVASPF